MINIPDYIAITFAGITLLTVTLFYIASGKNNVALLVLAILAVAQAVAAFSGFYVVTDGFPPRIITILLPSILIMLWLFFTEKGKLFINSFNLEMLTYMHTIRVGVEIVLFWLFVEKLVPESMTFTGHNFDIISGITAPLIAYFGWRLKKINSTVILIWNFFCLFLVLQVVTNGILSVPTAFQQSNFDQPNIAVLYFPIVWLPGIVVPLVLFSHILTIRRLQSEK